MWSPIIALSYCIFGSAIDCKFRNICFIQTGDSGSPFSWSVGPPAIRHLSAILWIDDKSLTWDNPFKQTTKEPETGTDEAHKSWCGKFFGWPFFKCHGAPIILTAATYFLHVFNSHAFFYMALLLFHPALAQSVVRHQHVCESANTGGRTS